MQRIQGSCNHKYQLDASIFSLLVQEIKIELKKLHWGQEPFEKNIIVKISSLLLTNKGVKEGEVSYPTDLYQSNANTFK